MSYRKIGKNKYRIEVETKVKGKRRRKTKIVNTRLKGKDLEYFISDIEKELYEVITDDIKFGFSDYTFVDFAKYVIDSSNTTQLTKDTNYKYLRVRTADYFKDMKLVDIMPYHIEAYIGYLKSEKNQRDGKPLSNKTIRHYRDFLRMIFNRAIKLEIITKNPVNNVDIPKVDNSLKRDYYTINEVKKVISKLESHGDLRYLVFFALQVYTGSRPSEMYGLKWEKLDLINGIITIDSALVRTSKGYDFKPTKTNDIRVTALSPYLILKLNELKDFEVAKHGTKKIDDKFVFTDNKGDYLNCDAFRNYLKKFCDKHNLKFVTPYGLRHTTGTLLVSEGVPMVNVSKVLGHTSTKTTDKYVHPVETVDNKIKNILTDITTPNLKLVK